MAILSSPLASAANNIVSVGNRSNKTLSKSQTEFNQFVNFLNVKKIEIEKIKLPDEKKIKQIANFNIITTFGTAGGLLGSLLGGALDLAGLVRGFFPGRGEEIGKSPKSKGSLGKPSVRGGKIRLSGIRALGIANAVFAGLDFATGLQEGESVGKAAAGAGGSLAGSLLGGAIGQALIPVPGLGFVLGSIAGGFLGGYAADRAVDFAEGNLKEKQEQKIREQEQRQKLSAGYDGSTQNFDQILMKFSESVGKFEDFVFNIGSIMGVRSNFENTNEGGGDIDVPTDDTPYDGPVSGETFNPLPGGVLSTAEVGVKGGEYGAPRNYPGGHSGQDIGGLPPGSPVVAWKTGKISYIGSVEPGDTILEIDHGGGVKSRYKHVVPTVPNGSIVYGGQQIAKLFAAKAYPEHLHFEVWKNGSHVNPMPYVKSAQKIPAPLSVDKAKQNSLSVANSEKQESGINIYPQSAESEPIKPLSKSNILPEASPQASIPTIQPLPQNIMMPPPKQEPQIQIYPSYSQGQSYIIDRPMIVASSGGGSSRKPIVIPSGSGGGDSSPIILGPSEGQVVNSLVKSILLTNLSFA